jgi:hypothetical protein
MRFRIGTLMLVVLILALAAALVSQAIRGARREASYQAEIARLRQEAAARNAFLTAEVARQQALQVSLRELLDDAARVGDDPAVIEPGAER